MHKAQSFADTPERRAEDCRPTDERVVGRVTPAFAKATAGKPRARRRPQRCTEARLPKSNPKSAKITCAAFLPGAMDTPGPG